MTWRFSIGALTVICLVVMAGSSFAQTASSGAIAGSVKDATAAVMPGVTVEAASPVLIEKVRAAVTDAQGNYKIIDLRPGTYSVTFTLPGFSTLRRDGVELSAGFTATANAELKVGGLEETITVTGASPVVDVQNSRAQSVLRAEQLDALPSGSRTVMSVIGLTLGAQPSDAGRNDVGGDKGESAAGIVIRGSRGDDGKVNLDGMNINNFTGAAGGRMRVYYPNMVAAQEVIIDTGGNTAESEVGGANQNLVPREGGNTFSVYGTANWTNGRLSAKSISDDLVARNGKPISSVKQIFDYGVGVGGPIRKDKVWYYATNRWWGSQSPGVNNYFNKSSDWRVYVPDLSRPGYVDQYYRDTSLRVTWQVSGKDKVTVEEHQQSGCSCWLGIGNGGLASPEATQDFLYPRQWLTQVTWTRTVANKLLLQVAGNFLNQGTGGSFANSALGKNWFTFTTTLPPVPETFRVVEQVGFAQVPAGWAWNALPAGSSYGRGSDQDNNNQRATVWYVTGSHAFKTGLQTLQGRLDSRGISPDLAARIPGRSRSYTFRAGLPVSLTQAFSLSRNSVHIHSLGLFAQDQWTISRLTLNYGVRYDQFKGRAPEITLDAVPFFAGTSLPALEDVPNFSDISLRVGGAYDLFGNGKTAVKGAFGRYLLGQGGGLTSTIAPASSLVTSANRTWNDNFFPAGDPRRGNYEPDCVLTNLLQTGECGQVDNLRFGQVVPNITLADEARTGWNVRQYNYQTSISLQHELRPGIGVAVGYFRTWWRNHTVTVNTLVAPTDFTSFCITAPTDTRLGDTSGARICGLYDVNPAKFGQVNRVIRLAKTLGPGQPDEIYNGVDVSMSARWGHGGFATGGVSLGQQTLDNCYANNRPDVTTVATTYPRDEAHCHIVNPWWAGGGQIKFQAAYPLPLGLQLSGAYKNVPGVPLTATIVQTNAQIAPALGRNLSNCAAGVSAAACTASVTVTLLPTGQAADAGGRTARLFDQRVNELDLRLTKMFRFGTRRRIQGIFDLYNVFNNRPAQGFNGAYGPSWLQVTSLLTGRLAKFGTQIDW